MDNKNEKENLKKFKTSKNEECHDKGCNCHSHDHEEQKHQHDHNHKEEHKHEHCDCGCEEDKECDCGDDCDCGHEHCECENGEEDNDYSNITNIEREYINMIQVLKADFDNYRKRTSDSLTLARQDGVISAVEVLLPSLDAFAKAKKMVDKENLAGIEMLETSMLSSLKNLGVEKIEALGQKMDPKLHNAIAVIEDKSKADGIIIEEFQAGYRIKDKIIRYSQVVVNKLKEE